MTPPDPQQVAEIAGRLSKAEREAVTSRKWRYLTLRRALEWPMEGTVERMPDLPHFWQASPLGLAVRNFIQGNSHD